MKERQLDVVSFADVEVKEVAWLIPPYIPLGKITILEGDPESGKTFLAIAMAAAVTSGTVMDLTGIPVEGRVPARTTPSNVLYFTGEDDLADTLKPRFLKQQGDQTRFFAVQGMVSERDGKKVEENFTLGCIAELEKSLQELRPALVVIDPLQAFLGSKVDMHRANEVRPVMSGLGKLADENRCAILIIRHLNKSVNQRSGYRGMGSIDFTAAARSVLLAGKNPRNPKQFALVHTKCANGPKGSSLTYSIGGDGLNWLGSADISADDLLGGTPSTVKPVDGAVAFLREILAAGPKASAEIQAAADERGISERTLQRAKHPAGVICRPSGFQGDWFWELGKPSGSLPPSIPSAPNQVV
jgi:archaellum biogenesis ATPase FlaH